MLRQKIGLIAQYLLFQNSSSKYRRPFQVKCSLTRQGPRKSPSTIKVKPSQYANDALTEAAAIPLIVKVTLANRHGMKSTDGIFGSSGTQCHVPCRSDQRKYANAPRYLFAWRTECRYRSIPCEWHKEQRQSDIGQKIPCCHAGCSFVKLGVGIL
jgi:hypothetical protein